MVIKRGLDRGEGIWYTTPAANEKPKLLGRLRQALRLRHYSRRTEQAYVMWVKRFIFFHNVRHPAEMAEPEINAFLTHLAVKEKVNASTQNQALCAILFLYRDILGRDIGQHLGQLPDDHVSRRFDGPSEEAIDADVPIALEIALEAGIGAHYILEDGAGVQGFLSVLAKTEHGSPPAAVG